MTSPAVSGLADTNGLRVDLLTYVADLRSTDPRQLMSDDELTDALVPFVEAHARRVAAEAWDDGYAAAKRDADEEPYSDRPERATWRPTANPFRPAVARPDQGTDDGEHPDSPLAWMQEVVDNRVRCAHCGEETPCGAKVRLHHASPEHRINCVPVKSCYLTCRALDDPAPAAHPLAGVLQDVAAPIVERDALRAELARWLCAERNGPEGWDYRPGRDGWLQDAARLLADGGPLADLLAQATADRAAVARVEALAAEAADGGWSSVAYRLRAALRPGGGR